MIYIDSRPGGTYNYNRDGWDSSQSIFNNWPKVRTLYDLQFDPVGIRPNQYLTISLKCGHFMIFNLILTQNDPLTFQPKGSS